MWKLFSIHDGWLFHNDAPIFRGTFEECVEFLERIMPIYEETQDILNNAGYIK